MDVLLCAVLPSIGNAAHSHV